MNPTSNPQRLLRRTLLASLTASAALGLAPNAVAQNDWPARPITIVVPFTPGTGIDVLARTLGPKLAERLGQSVIVDNRPGASGNIGNTAVANAAPDGYTLLMTVSTFVMSAGLYKDLPFHPVNSFTAVAQTATGAQGFVVTPGFPAKDMKEAIALLKAKPDAFTYASPGNGTPPHMAMELLKLNIGAQVRHIPYKGSSGAITDLLAGHVDMMILPVNAAWRHVESGKLKMLGVARDTRLEITPDVPTFLEQGLPNTDVDLWFGLLAPAKTPAAVINRLNAEINEILVLPDVRKALETQGLTPAPNKPEALTKLISDDYVRWADVIKKAKIQAD
ncbi:MAG: tripartite tricarboxylate transporter substrate binding protein [Pigmentiphaga sp.]|nr:tripartite tricarboxylate transporter substrate binding protein [Pigmentiphaga sp.]